MSKFTYRPCTGLIPVPRFPKSLPTMHFHLDVYDGPKGRKQRLPNLPPGTLAVALLYLSHASGKELNQSLQPVSHEGLHWPPDCHGCALAICKVACSCFGLGFIAFPITDVPQFIAFFLTHHARQSRDLGWHRSVILGRHLHALYSKSLGETGNCFWWLEVGRT